MAVVEAVFHLAGVLAGVVVALVGLLLTFGLWSIGRRSQRRLPDEAGLPAAWRRHGITPLPDAHPALLEAAVRLDEGDVDKGHEALGLPGGFGVRLAGRLDDWFVGDVWNVNSVTSSGERVTSATVQVRAVAALPLDRTAPRVLVGRERGLRLLADAVGLDDVLLESDEFNRSFRIRAESREAAFAVVTPQVIDGLQRARGHFVLEVGDDLLTLVEVSGRGGRPARGQAGALDDLVTAMRGIAAGTRPHTWPEASPTWQLPRLLPRRRRSPQDVAVDPRAPGTDHPAPPSTGLVGDLVLGGVALGFAVAGLLLAGTNLAAL